MLNDEEHGDRGYASLIAEVHDMHVRLQPLLELDSTALSEGRLCISLSRAEVQS